MSEKLLRTSHLLNSFKRRELRRQKTLHFRDTASDWYVINMKWPRPRKKAAAGKRVMRRRCLVERDNTFLDQPAPLQCKMYEAAHMELFRRRALISVRNGNVSDIISRVIVVHDSEYLLVRNVSHVDNNKCG